jgi:nitrogen fixation protein NifB
LARLQVSHVTLTVNAVDPAIGAGIYAWVRDGRAIYRGEAAASHLLARQKSAIAALKAAGITVKINTIIVPGINQDHICEVAEEMRKLGADIMNCVPLYPVEDTPFADKEELPGGEIKLLREQVASYLPQMEHCTRCRADAIGLLGEPSSRNLIDLMRACASASPDAESERPYIAVASMEGILVNQHLGEATRLWIFERTDGEPKLVELRYTPEVGGGNQRWRDLAESINDCHAVVVSGIGRAPRWVLERAGLRVIEMSGLISEGLGSLFRTGGVPLSMRKQFKSCGSGCQGTGTGCA